ncbi:antibiotic biosynthesis monooxygenase [Maribacter algarum]|uniref:Antibiotic biosynthesis monooxygenase n=1 Tax=Maribacter algarum (ex Zhang et al. 2020) TaxID=2578118 RepID=A0A5S3PHL0_9FLAO|nr:antibiotic biosynthesis monooxygenase [Maribacter algarum]TMM53748.1 antibiotic biosynthesis monooxygenase [Maribacter algarum]
MFVRIVKMKFVKENIPLFKAVFEESKQTIRSSEGCTFLELYQDKKDKTIFFTYSYWEEEANLETYRNSDFFKLVWARTKVLFSAKPEAWSVNKVESLP